MPTQINRNLKGEAKQPPPSPSASVIAIGVGMIVEHKIATLNIDKTRAVAPRATAKKGMWHGHAAVPRSPQSKAARSRNKIAKIALVALFTEQRPKRTA